MFKRMPNTWFLSLATALLSACGGAAHAAADPSAREHIRKLALYGKVLCFTGR